MQRCSDLVRSVTPDMARAPATECVYLTGFVMSGRRRQIKGYLSSLRGSSVRREVERT